MKKNRKDKRKSATISLLIAITVTLFSWGYCYLVKRTIGHIHVPFLLIVIVFLIYVKAIWDMYQWLR